MGSLKRILLVDIVPRSDDWRETNIALDIDGHLMVSIDRWGSGVKLAPEHAYYLAAMLTKWADAQEMEDNS